MKILYYSEDVPGAHTGFGNQGEFLVEHWVKSGHEVFCVAPNAPISRAFGALVLPGNLADVVNLIDILRLGPEDKIVCLTETWILHPYWQVLRPVAKRLTAIAVIDGHPIGQRDRLLWDSIGQVVTISRFAHRELPNSTYIPHGVNIEFFTPIVGADRWALRKAVGCERAFVVGIVGGNHSLKGIHVAVEAVGLLSRKYLNVRMALKTEVTPALAEWVEMCGVKLVDLKVQTMRQLYGLMDVHVLPSQGEAFGIAVGESQACGVPNVVTAYSGCKELVEGHGELIPVSLWRPCTCCNLPRAFVTAQDVADKIEKLYLDKKLREKYSKMAVTAMQEYSWRNVLAAWDALFAQ